MLHEAHTLVQDTNDAQSLILDAIHNNVFTDQVSAMRIRQVFSMSPYVWIFAQLPQRTVDFVAIDFKLSHTPFFTRVTKDVDKIPSRLR